MMTSTELKHQARLQNWATAIQDCRSSGLSVKQWCKQREITTTTYYRWERELLSLARTASDTTKDPAVTFVELPAPKKQSRNISERVATIHISDSSIDIYAEARPEQLKAIVETLRSC